MRPVPAKRRAARSTPQVVGLCDVPKSAAAEPSVVRHGLIERALPRVLVAPSAHALDSKMSFHGGRSSGCELRLEGVLDVYELLGLPRFC